MELNNKIRLVSNNYQKESNTSNSSKTIVKPSKDKIRELADAYCEFSIYNTWEQQNNKIIFKKKVFLFGSVSEKSIPINSLEREIKQAKMQKMNHINSLERERKAMKNKTLYSKPKPNLNFTVKDLAEKICQKTEFTNYDLSGNRTLIFDNKYTLDLTVNFLGELYTALNSNEHKKEKRNVVYDHYLLWESYDLSREDYVSEYIYEYYDIDGFYILNNDHVLLFGGDSDSIRYIEIDEILKTFKEQDYEREEILAEMDQFYEDINNYDYYFDID